MRAQLNHRVTLDQSLGAWIPAVRHVQHDFYRTRFFVYARFDEHSPSLFERMEAKEGQNYFTPTGIAIKLPNDAHPTVVVEGLGDKFHPTTPFTFHRERQTSTESNDDEEKLEQNGLDILQDAEQLITCSDGSYDSIAKKAAFNWRIVDQDRRGAVSRPRVLQL
jgi:hypothetical protein